MSKISLKELQGRINERKSLVATIVRFIANFVGKEGETLKHYKGDFHTHIVKEVNDFGGFRLRFSDGESQFGGTTVTLHYRSEIVFNYHSQGSEDDGRVEFFSDDKNWLPAFKRIMRDRDRLLKLAKENKKKAQAKLGKRSKDELLMINLLKEADRLMLPVGR